jgi:Transposase IS200 like
MTMARAHLVDPAVTRWYHCVSRCVRRAFLLGEGEHDRKAWIENRIRELAEIFAVSVAGFAILDNHLHLLIRLDPHVADAWSDEEVVQRCRKVESRSGAVVGGPVSTPRSSNWTGGFPASSFRTRRFSSVSSHLRSRIDRG